MGQGPTQVFGETASGTGLVRAQAVNSSAKSGQIKTPDQDHHQGQRHSDILGQGFPIAKKDVLDILHLSAPAFFVAHLFPCPNGIVKNFLATFVNIA